jgi:hypothetical protein
VLDVNNTARAHAPRASMIGIAIVELIAIAVMRRLLRRAIGRAAPA